ncbi:hypothetical protein [Suipraeoptans intestinalis]|uniref:hypothetical protein n=1 Tax=Suipraeoptans intestinalis TaxID=2606628 RepID=UPI001F250C45|nr:hypothetical protein [Suipraeoptans intestinalis]
MNSTEMLSIYIYKQAFQKVDYSMAGATATVLLVVSVVIAVFYVRPAKESEELTMIGSYKPWMKVVSSILLVIGGIFAAFPILWMVCSSFKANEAIFSWPPKFIDKTAGVHAYLEVLTDPEKIRFS